MERKGKERKEKIKLCFVAFADLSSVNTVTMANFKLPKISQPA